MKIRDDHLYHGAALIQIAEHELFTAINSLKVGSKTQQNSYKINDEIVIHLKYATKKMKSHSEYSFTFSTQHLMDLAKIKRGNPKTFIALVCVGAREICCVSFEELDTMIEARKAANEIADSQYTILVTVPAGKSMRAYVNAPGKRNTILGNSKIITRSDFPGRIFR
jgi:hypothetical protein